MEGKAQLSSQALGPDAQCRGMAACFSLQPGPVMGREGGS